jgi:hypothetical protein
MAANKRNKLRDHLDFVLGHAILHRSASKRGWELADLGHMVLDGEGPTQCDVLFLNVRKHKTNHSNDHNVSPCMRFKNVYTCPLGALAMYLFDRWHIENEAFPDFTENKK